MPIMLCTHDRCLLVATTALPRFEGAVHLCCLLDADLLIRSASEPRSSLRGCSEMAPNFVCDMIWRRQSVTDFWEGNCGRGWGGTARGGGRWVGEQGGEHTASSVVEIRTWHQTPQHIKRRRTPPPCVSHPSLFPLLPRRGADVAHSR